MQVLAISHFCLLTKQQRRKVGQSIGLLVVTSQTVREALLFRWPRPSSATAALWICSSGITSFATPHGSPLRKQNQHKANIVANVITTNATARAITLSAVDGGDELKLEDIV